MNKENKIISCFALLAFLAIPIYHIWENNEITKNPSVTFGIIEDLYYAHYHPYFSYTYRSKEKNSKVLKNEQELLIRSKVEIR